MRAHFVAMTALAFLVGSAAMVEGQRGPRGMADRGEPGIGLERTLERALDLREEVGLTEAQVSELEALRSEVESAFAPLRAEMDALRSEARDRSGDPDEVRARMIELRERQRALHARLDTIRSPLQARFEQTVPPIQRQGLLRNARGVAGARSGLAGRPGIARGDVGFRNGRGNVRGTPRMPFRGRPGALLRGPRIGGGGR